MTKGALSTGSIAIEAILWQV